MDLVYHYTSLSGAEGILASRRMWATHLRYLNDSKEFQYSLETLQAALEAESAAWTGAVLLGRFLTRLFDNAPWPEAFVLSFSAAGDQLGQWRAYCGGGPGISLGFDSHRLGDLLRAEGLKLGPCVYDQEVQRRLFQPLAKQVVADFPPPADIPDNWSHMSPDQRFASDYAHFAKVMQQSRGETSFGPMVDVMVAVGNLGPLLKHPAFAEEREWRAILATNLKETNVQFRSGRSTLLPYVSVPVIDHDGKSPLVEIVIGPCPQPALTFDALKLLVRQDSTYADVKVRVSETPYRYW
jgi:hypothetical protein